MSFPKFDPQASLHPHEILDFVNHLEFSVAPAAKEAEMFSQAEDFATAAHVILRLLSALTNMQGEILDTRLALTISQHHLHGKAQ